MKIGTDNFVLANAFRVLITRRGPSISQCCLSCTFYPFTNAAESLSDVSIAAMRTLVTPTRLFEQPLANWGLWYPASQCFSLQYRPPRVQPQLVGISVSTFRFVRCSRVADSPVFVKEKKIPAKGTISKRVATVPKLPARFSKYSYRPKGPTGQKEVSRCQHGTRYD